MTETPAQRVAGTAEPAAGRDSPAEIMKVIGHKGQVVWRMSSRRNPLTLRETQIPAFLRQHSVRVTGPGRLLLLDRGRVVWCITGAGYLSVQTIRSLYAPGIGTAR